MVYFESKKLNKKKSLQAFHEGHTQHPKIMSFRTLTPNVQDVSISQSSIWANHEDSSWVHMQSE